MSALITWAIIGAVFFFGIVMEHSKWTKRDILMLFPCFIGVVLLWPFGLMYRALSDIERNR